MKKISISIVLFTTIIVGCSGRTTYFVRSSSNTSTVISNSVLSETRSNKVAINYSINKEPCPSDMVEVNGDYCVNEEQICLYNTDNDGNRLPGPGDVGKACGEYKNPTRCLSDKIHLHFCIDKYEYPNVPGRKPQDWMTYFDAKREAESVGKRLCTAKEWTLAAEGPNMHPLPYGDGYHRDSAACNFDNKNPGIDVFKAGRPNDDASQKLRNLLVESGSKLRCFSDFGVYDMAGNIDEWVVNESGTSCINKTTGNCISGLKGGHIWHVRNASRPMTTVHGEGFSWYETGARFCASL